MEKVASNEDRKIVASNFDKLGTPNYAKRACMKLLQLTVAMVRSLEDEVARLKEEAAIAEVRYNSLDTSHHGYWQRELKLKDDNGVLKKELDRLCNTCQQFASRDCESLLRLGRFDYLPDVFGSEKKASKEEDRPLKLSSALLIEVCAAIITEEEARAKASKDFAATGDVVPPSRVVDGAIGGKDIVPDSTKNVEGSS
ncbi:uncharacterized protein G2W53_000796 [Senna tora]|uniref:Uncharacterized protein n=1 Tax=Senna tora TaxID=362788 RepID=A0A834XH81_9FABA|nr:uncharacterized protein G2W53_000796 [Senna tora]